jgi:hypothetical protein
MTETQLDLSPSYWQDFQPDSKDLDQLTAYLLDIETPLSPQDLLPPLIEARLVREEQQQTQQQTQGNEVYLPKGSYKKGQTLAFPGLDWKSGEVLSVRAAQTLNGHDFQVIEVQFKGEEPREFAAALAEHALNEQPEQEEPGQDLSAAAVIADHGDSLAARLEDALRENPDFVYIAGRWFPKALIVDVGEGQLNLAEALLDMAEGGPLPTEELLGQVDLADGTNPKLAAFSLDLALQEDERFDEVGPAGEVGWFLHRAEPEAVRETPVYLRYREIEHDRSALSEDMLNLERQLDDELSPIEDSGEAPEQVEVRLIFPHWQAGTLPLTDKVARLFPTAYEAPRVHFDFVDAENGERFPGWVVRTARYVHGLREWYAAHGLMPGGYVRARRGEKPGEILVSTAPHRSSKEWVRTALIGADGGLVFANLKQTVGTSFDEHMMIYMPSETDALNAVWKQPANKRPAFVEVVTRALRNLAELNPQNHVHASELYAVVNLTLRVPPAPLLSLLARGSDFLHVGDLHYRLAGSEGARDD